MKPDTEELKMQILLWSLCRETMGEEEWKRY